MSPFVLAHGVGGRSDLPLPAWMFAYGAGFAVLISFVALGILWTKPRLAAASDGRALPSWAQAAARPVTWMLRAFGLLVCVVVVVACLWGSDEGGSNLAPFVIYVSFWVGVQLLATLFGDVWRALNPFETIALALGRRIPERTQHADPGLWPAALMLLTFAWMELCCHEPASPRALGVWLALYSGATIVGTVWWGRAWLREGEGFAALFALSLIASPSSSVTSPVSLQPTTAPSSATARPRRRADRSTPSSGRWSSTPSPA